MHLAMTVVVSMGRLRLVAILRIRENRWKINLIAGSVPFYPEVGVRYKMDWAQQRRISSQSGSCLTIAA